MPEPVYELPIYWFPAYNQEAETCPPGAVVEIKSVDVSTGIAKIGKPSADGQTTVFFNSGAAIPSLGTGQCYRTDPSVEVAYQADNDTATDPVHGETWGTQTGSWYLHKDETGFQVIGAGGFGFCNVQRTGGGGTPTDSFKTIAVPGQSDIVADSPTDTLTVVAGTAMTITTAHLTDTITFNCSILTFKTIRVSGQSDVVADLPDDILTFIAGTATSITTNPSGDEITFNSVVLSFSTIAVSGQSDVVADSALDTLTLESGGILVITTTPSTDKITFTVDVNAYLNSLSGYSSGAARQYLIHESGTKKWITPGAC